MNNPAHPTHFICLDFTGRPDSCWRTLLLSFFSYQLYTIPNCFHIFKHSGDSWVDYKRRLCDQQDGRRHQKWEITAACLARGSNPQSADKNLLWKVLKMKTWRIVPDRFGRDAAHVWHTCDGPPDPPGLRLKNLPRGSEKQPDESQPGLLIGRSRWRSKPSGMKLFTPLSWRHITRGSRDHGSLLERSSESPLFYILAVFILPLIINRFKV